MSETESDCSSPLSLSEENSDSGEDIGDQLSVVQPYQDKPLAPSDYEEEDEADKDGIQRATLEARFRKTIPLEFWSFLSI